MVKKPVNRKKTARPPEKKGDAVSNHAEQTIRKWCSILDVPAFSMNDLQSSQISSNLATFEKVLKDGQTNANNSQIRLQNLMDAVIAISALDFTKRVDITDRQDGIDALGVGINMLSEELEASIVTKKYLDTVFNTMINAVVILDETGIILDVNLSFCELTGYVMEELIGKDFSMITGKDAQSWKGQIEDSGLVRNIELVYHLKNGSGIPVLFSANRMFDQKSNRLNIICVAQDISELTRSQEDLKIALKKLESTNRELKDFAYIISHDLKAPLRAIYTLADWLVMDYKDKLDDTGKEQILLLKNRVVRMQGLIDGVLQYSRLTNQKEEVTDVNLYKIMDEVFDILNIREKTELAIKNALPTVRFPKTRMFQLIQNLVSNAVKYCDKPKCRIEIDCIDLGNSWEFTLSDNGPGIDSKYFEKIFQIFQTLESRDNVESTGIGLTIVKKIVELYGGTITVRSRMGEGTTFIFTVVKNLTLPS